MSSTTPSNSPGSSTDEIFIARQAIFDAEQAVFAYELLFRSGESNYAEVTDGNSASSQVMLNAFLEIGIENIIGDHRCFINLTRDFIVGHLPLPLPSDVVTIEVLEDIEVDQELVESLKEFSDQGYTIALDDYVFTGDKDPLLEVIDILKIDIMECDRATLASDVEKLKSFKLKLLAEKVETQEEFELCKSLGFHYYQGYFFSKPNIVSGQALKPSRASLLQMLSLTQNPDCDIRELEQLIKLDLAISYKILRIINSSLYGLRREIQSIKEAIVALGMQTIRDWLIVIMMTDLDDKPPELFQLCLQRAKMLQLLSQASSIDPDTGFTTGLLSTLDALMDQPMDFIVKELPLSDDIESALLGQDNELGRLLRTVLHYERGEWKELRNLSDKRENLAAMYLDSVAWASTLNKELATG